jgi:hypothetical protein
MVGIGVPGMLYRSGVLLSEARRSADLDPLEARRRTFGAEYVEAIETIRRDLPPDAWYLLVPQNASREEGWELWVRYDLAPRRPILLRSRGGRGLRGPRGEGVPRSVRWAVVRGDDGVPRLLTRGQLLARRRRHDGGG